MKTTKHNPDYKLISFTKNNKEFVLGQTNTGHNLGLEVYYGVPEFHYSRRYASRQIPMIYNELAARLFKFLDKCSPGHKLVLTAGEVYSTTL